MTDDYIILKTRDQWIAYGNKYGWRATEPAPLIFRLPVIRWVRSLYHFIHMEIHYSMWSYIGSGARSGYDEWYLFGMFHGWV